MREWDDEGFVLRIGHFREADVWLRVLFAHQGLQTVFAFGGARSRRRFCGCLDRYNRLSCRVRESRAGVYLTLQEAQLTEGTRNLRVNWKLSGLVANCCAFIDATTVDCDSAEDIFSVFGSLRALLERSSSAPGWLPYFFRLRVAAGLGFAPNLETCGSCGGIIGAGSFLPSDGRIFCARCAQAHKRRAQFLHASEAAVRSLSFVQRSLPEAWDRVVLNTEDSRAASRIADAFVQYHLGSSSAKSAPDK